MVGQGFFGPLALLLGLGFSTQPFRLGYEVGLVGGQTANMGTRAVSRSIRLPCRHEEIWKGLNSGHHTMAHPTLMMRTELIKKAGGYWKHRLADDDIDMMLRMGEITRLGNIDKVLLHYRLRQDSLCGLNMRGFDSVLSMPSNLECGGDPVYPRLAQRNLQG